MIHELGSSFFFKYRSGSKEGVAVLVARGWRGEGERTGDLALVAADANDV